MGFALIRRKRREHMQRGLENRLTAYLELRKRPRPSSLHGDTGTEITTTGGLVEVRLNECDDHDDVALGMGRTVTDFEELHAELFG